MVFLIIALAFLISKKSVKYRYIFGGIFTVIALLCKLHILAVIPIIFFYLQKRDSIRKACEYVIGVILAMGIVILPIWSEGFRQMVLFNKEQMVLTKVAFNFDTVQLYIPIIAVLFIYLLTFKINYMNRELFFNLCGIVFAVFLAFCPPMPGWYVWIVPFIALFFAAINKEKYKNIAIYAVLNVIYLIYFIFLHNREAVDLYLCKKSLEWIKYNNSVISNGTFTILSGILIYLIISMYQFGVASNSFYKRKKYSVYYWNCGR